MVAATHAHNIDKISVQMGETQSWTFVYCTCGNVPDREAFTEPWEFTDHIRRLVFEALGSPEGTEEYDHAEHFDPACEECAYLARPTRETLTPS